MWRVRVSVSAPHGALEERCELSSVVRCAGFTLFAVKFSIKDYSAGRRIMQCDIFNLNINLLFFTLRRVYGSRIRRLAETSRRALKQREQWLSKSPFFILATDVNCDLQFTFLRKW